MRHTYVTKICKLSDIQQIYAVQHVDVCMFSNGKFKNVVADIHNENPIGTGERLNETYTLIPTKGISKIIK